MTVSIDAVADAALRSRTPGGTFTVGLTPPKPEAPTEPALTEAVPLADELRCDVCDDPIEGDPPGRGLYMWSRDSEIRFEEPALCAKCATAIGVTALAAWSVEEEGG